MLKAEGGEGIADIPSVIIIQGISGFGFRERLGGFRMKTPSVCGGGKRPRETHATARK